MAQDDGARPGRDVPLDLVRRDFAVDAAQINTRWCGDITYINTWQGWLYLATVLDLGPAGSWATRWPTISAPT